MIPVLVVDDSPTARDMLRTILSADPEIQVVGEASDGRAAVDLTRRLRPKVVTMDIQMPRMDGLEAITHIMAETPTPIVVVTGSMRANDVQATLQALRAGAVSLLRKPPGPASPLYDQEARRLVDTVRAMADVKVVGRTRPPMQAPVPPVGHANGMRPSVVAIGASTGGPAALHRLVSELPPDFAAAILVVQHMSSGFIPGLAQWLGSAATLAVQIAAPGDAIRPRTVYIAPDDAHLGVSSSGVLELSSAPPIGGFRPSATFLFESVARTFGRRALAVVLTGMGTDGVAGLRAIRAAGGRVIAQGEASSVVYGMPAAAVATGLTERTVELDELASYLITLTNGGSA